MQIRAKKTRMERPLSGVDRGRPIAARRGRPEGEERIIALCDAVLDLAGALFDIPSRELRRPGRSSSGISRARQIAMYVAHVVLRLSMAEVGRGFGRDRTTVLHACHLVEDLRDDPEFDRVVAVAERIARAAFVNPRL